MPDFKRETQSCPEHGPPLDERRAHSPFGALFQQASFADDVEKVGKQIIDRLEAIERKIDLIFGNHVLVRGRFVDISHILEKEEQCRTSK